MEDPLPPLALPHSLSAITSPSTAEWLWLCCEHPTQHLLVRSAGMSGGHVLDSFPLLFAPSFLVLLGWGSLCPPILHLPFSAKLSVEVPWVAIILDSFLPFPKLTRWLSPPGGAHGSLHSGQWHGPQTRALVFWPVSFFLDLLPVSPFSTFSSQNKSFSKANSLLRMLPGFFVAQ